MVIRYVDAGATGANNGSSWGDAYSDLQMALAAAQSGDEIWVARGTYQPTTGMDRTATFQLKNGVALYGGFAGTETALSQRNLTANITILSGDTGALGDNSDNSYNVVTGSNTDSTAVIDGFQVTGGNANGSSFPYYAGGGMLNQNGSPTVTNVIFSSNAAQDGAGMYNFAGASPTLTNVVFYGNTALSGGGGLYNNSSSNPTLINVTFSGNSAGYAGGGIYNINSSNPQIQNSIFWNNTAASLGTEIYNYSSTPTISNSLIQGSGGSTAWDASLGTNGGNNLDTDPLFIDTATGDLRLQSGSPAIDAGNNGVSLPTTDLAGNPRIVDGDGNGIDVTDMGAYEKPYESASGVAPGGITPNLQLWLKANAGVTQSGGSISTWVDQSANGNSATQATSDAQPLFEAEAINGNAAVVFDGVNDVLRGVASTAFSTPSTIFAVAIQPVPKNDPAGIFSAGEGGVGIYGNLDDQYIMDGIGAWAPKSANTSSPINQFRVITASYQNVNTTYGSQIFLDGGLEEYSFNDQVGVDVSPYFEIGGRTMAGGIPDGIPSRLFYGKIAEVIVYNNQLSPLEQHQVESYLGLKYGISLSSNYLDSSGNTIFDRTGAFSSFANDITGIGQDDGSELVQLQSRSINTDDIVTIGNTSNLNNKEFLIWGNNNDDNGIIEEISTGAPEGVSKRVDRVWRVAETGEVGTVTVSFDLTGLSVSGTQVSDFRLLIDADGDFTTGATSLTASNLNGSTVTFTGVNFTNGDFFTLGTTSGATGNQSPTAIALSNNAITENVVEVVIGTFTVADPDAGDTHTLAVSDSRFEVVGGQLKLKTGQSLDFEAEPTVNLSVTATDQGGLSRTQAFTINVTNANEAPTAIALSSNSVAENAVAAVIGNLTVTDPDAGNTHTFTVTDSRFEVVGGQLKLKAGQSLDFEKDPSVNLSVTATDQGGLSRAQAFTINVTNANEAPTAIALSSNSVAENAVAAVIGNLTVTDPDAGNTHTFTVTDSRFEVVGGQLRLKAGQSLNFEAEPIVNLSVTATDQGGLSRAQAFTINVTNANEAPTAIALSSNSVAENAVAAVIGNLTVTDPDAGNTHTFTVTDSRFEVVGGQLKLKAGQSLDFEKDPSVNLSVTATDQGGLSRAQAFTINVTNANEAPTAIALSSNSVAENAVAAVIGNLTVTDPDAGNTHTFTVTDSRFEVVGGQLKLKAGQSLDFEKDPSVNLSVTATDQGGLSTTQAFTVNVTNANEAPTAIVISNKTVVENAVAAVIGNLTVTDPDVGNTHTLIVNDSRFEVVGGQLRLKAGQSLDFEKESTVNLSVTATDQNGLSITQAFTVNVINANEAPTAIALSSNSVAENAVAAVIGNLTVADPDAGNTHTFTVTDNRFVVIGNQLRLKAGQSLNFEAEPTVNLTVTATDQGGLSTKQTFTINVTNANDAPTAITLSNNSVAENAVAAVIGNLTAADPDVGNTHTFTVTDSRFEVIGNQLRLKAGQSLNFEAEPTVNLTVTATDQGGLSTKQTFTINVTNANEAPTAIALSNATIPEDTAGVVIGNLTVTDPDGNNTNTFNVNDSRFEVVGNQLKLKADQSLNFETTPSLNLSITATDQGGLSTSQAFAIAVTNINANLPSVPEDTTNPVGNSIADLFGGIVSNLNGVAVVENPANSTTQGRWQYFLPGAFGQWFDVGSVSSSSALVLSQNTHIRFLPATNYNGTPPNLTVRALNNTYTGSYTSLVFSSPQATYRSITPSFFSGIRASEMAASNNAITTSITAVNDAPSFTGNATLQSVLANNRNPAGATIASLLGDKFSDVDTGSSFKGVAVTGNTANATTQGKWQYSTLSWTTPQWHDIASVSDSTALILAPHTRVRFVPVDNYIGTPPGLTVRALDDTYSGQFTHHIAFGGTQRRIIDVATNGGITAISGNANTIDTSIAGLVASQNFQAGIQSGLGQLVTILNSDLAGASVPILGSLGDRYVPDFLKTLTGSLVTGMSGTSMTTTAFANLLRTNLPGATVSTDTSVPGQTEFTVDLTRSSNLTTSLSSNLGLPLLNLSTSGQATTTVMGGMKLTFGFSKDYGFYFNTDRNKTYFGADLNANLSDGFTATGTLGFLQTTLTNNPSNPTGVTAGFKTYLKDLDNISSSAGDGDRLTLAELQAPGSYGIRQRFGTELVITPKVGFKAKTGVTGTDGLPALNFDLGLNWSAFSYQDGVTTTASPTLSLDNVQLDMGKFVTNFARPIFDRIDQVIAPFRPIIDVLNTDTKIFTALKDDGFGFDQDGNGKVTLIEAVSKLNQLSGSNSFDVRFLDAITALDQATRTVRAIPSGSNLMIDLGSYTMGQVNSNASQDTLQNAPATQTRAAASPNAQTSSNSSLQSFFTALNNVQGLGFPILTDSTQAINLLLGKTANLFTYDMPDLNIRFDISKKFPIFGPLEGLLSGSFSAATNLAFGYDTYGLSQWKNAGFSAASATNLVDGFYVFDQPGNELQLNARVSAGGSLNLGVVRGSLSGGIQGNIGIDLIDVNESVGRSDAKLRTSEITSRISRPQDLFDINGSVSGFVNAKVESWRLGPWYEPWAGRWNTDWSKDLASFQLASFSAGAPNNGRVSNKYIAGATVFLDANFNDIQDEYEPFTFSNIDGSYTLNIPMENYDKNGNGTIDLDEGCLISLGGTDTFTNQTIDVPLSAPAGYQMITPVTSLIDALVQQQIDANQAESQVKRALGLPTAVELETFDPIAAMRQDDPNGTKVMIAHVTIETLLDQTVTLLEGNSTLPRDLISAVVTNSLTTRIQSGQPLDLTQPRQVEALIQTSIKTLETVEPTQNWQKVNAIADEAAQVMAEGVKRMEAILRQPNSVLKKLEEVAELQAYLGTETAQDLKAAATGRMPVSELIAQNTGDGLEENLVQEQATQRQAMKVGTRRSDKLQGTAKADLMFGGDGKDLLYGRTGADLLAGGRDADQLTGGSDADTLNGENGRDSLFGGWGKDLLIGGAGRDILMGGIGHDQFRLNVAQHGIDRILDFSVKVDMLTIELAQPVAELIAGSSLTSDQLHIGKKAMDVSDRFIYNSRSGVLFFDEDGIGAMKQKAVAQLAPELGLTHANIAISL